MRIGKPLSFSIIIAGLAFCAIGARAADSSGPAKKTLDVGIVLRLNDQYNESVSSMVTGIETAKALFEKEHPGVLINLRRYSHNEDLASVVAASDQVIKDKIPAVIGGELSEESIVLRDKLGPNKIVFITPTSSNPSITENQPYAFRACFSDRLVASHLANFTIDHLKPSVVGVIHNVSSPYTDFLSKQFIQTFQEREAKSAKPIPLIEEKVLRDTVDYDSPIKRFMENHVTHVIMPVHQTDLLRFVTQASAKKFFPVYIGSDGWGSNENLFSRIVKDSSTGSHFIAFRNSYWKEDSTSSMAKLFKAEYTKINSKSPSAWSAISFDAAWLLFTAMNSASNPKNGSEIKSQLKALKNIKLVTTDSFSFGADNSPRKDLFMYRLDKDGVRYEVTLK